MNIEVKHFVKESWKGDGFEFTFEPVPDSFIVEKTETGYRVKYLTIDNSPESPREWDNLGTMVCFHDRYDFGDETNYNRHEFNDFDSLREKIGEDNKVAVILPLYLLDHSGLRMSTKPFNDRWDSGQVGFIYVTEERVIKEYGDISIESRIKALNALEGEVLIYDQYLSGDVYSVVVETYDEAKNPVNYDICGGYYGREYAMGELKKL